MRMRLMGKDGSTAIAVGSGVMSSVSFVSKLATHGKKIMNHAMMTATKNSKKNPFLNPSVIQGAMKGGKDLRALRKMPAEHLKKQIRAKMKTGAFKPNNPEDMHKLIKELRAEANKAANPQMAPGKSKRKTPAPGM